MLKINFEELTKKELQKRVSYYSRELGKFARKHPSYTSTDYMDFGTYNALDEMGMRYVNALRDRNTVTDAEHKTINHFFDNQYAARKLVFDLLYD